MEHIYEKYKERGVTPTFRPKDLMQYETVLSSLQEAASTSPHVKDIIICEKLTSLLTLLMEDSWTAEEKNTAST